MSTQPSSHADDLIDDRALRSATGDEFDHRHFVAELAELVRSVKTPCNVALFAPWGAGKTGMAHMLAEALDGDPRVEFIRFDAFKYAEAPLRRQFLSSVGQKVGWKREQVDERLYGKETHTRLKLPRRQVGLLFGIFVVGLALLAALAVVVALAYGLVARGAFQHEFREALGWLAPRMVLPAAALAVIASIAGKQFVVDRAIEAPASDEEFESTFRDIVVDAIGVRTATEPLTRNIDDRKKRLVIFVDELDRCGPDEVVSTLETIRTFLEVDGCVFLVAADHQVLERSLRAQVRQATPADVANPYFSAGSSYLDKVFQHQVTLPPYKPQHMSSFALKTVANRQGVWSRIENLDETVSVLVPTHVTSPRRVKVLLNAYGLAYRLAERRVADGKLDPELPKRAPELAKLVCLRSEFPLFADDLALDTRLPGLVVSAADDKASRPSSVPLDVWKRAGLYADGKLPVAELLIEDDDSAPPEDNDSDGQRSRASDVSASQAQQLLAYLRKTLFIPGPGADLVFLESAGADLSLEPGEADRLERAARDGDEPTVLDIVVPMDASRQHDAILLLSGLVRQAPPGVEGRNAVSTLLATVARTGSSLGNIADTVAAAVAAHSERFDLRAGDLVGAAALARQSSHPVGDQLLAAVLRAPEATEDGPVAEQVVLATKRVPDSSLPVLGRCLAYLLLNYPDAAADALLKLEPADAERALSSSEHPVTERVVGHLEAAATEPADEDEEAPKVLDKEPAPELGRALDRLIEKHSPLAQLLARMMLAVDHTSFRDAIQDRLEQLAPITDATTSTAVLRAAKPRQTRLWPTWLASLEPEGTDWGKEAAAALGALSATAINRMDRTSGEPDTADIARAGIAAIGRLVQRGLSIAREPALKAVSRHLSDRLYTAEEVAADRGLLEFAEEMRDLGLLETQALADVDLKACVASMDSVPAGQAVAAEVQSELVRRVSRAARYGTPELVISAIAAAHNAPISVLPQVSTDQLAAIASLRLRERGVQHESLVSLDELSAFVVDHGSQFDWVVGEWLLAYPASPQEILGLLTPWLSQELPPKSRSALHELSGRMTPDARSDLVVAFVRRLPTTAINRDSLAAVRLSTAELEPVAAALIEDAREIDNDLAAWRRILEAWQQLSPSSDAIRRRLINDVYLPSLGLGDPGVELAIEFFGLVDPAPRGTKEAVRDRLRSSASDDEQKREIDRRLMAAGWIKKSLFGLGPVVDVDEPAPSEDN